MTIELLKADPYYGFVKTLYESLGITEEAADAEISRAAAEPVLASQTDSLQRFKAAAGIYYARLSKNQVVKVELHTVRVLSTAAPVIRTNKQKQSFRVGVAQVIAQAKRAGAKQALGELSFYDDPVDVKAGFSNADRINDLKEGVTYEVLASGFYKDGAYKLGADRRTTLNTIVPTDPTPVTELVAKMYQRVVLADLKKYVGKTVAVEANIAIASVRNRKGGKGQFGSMTLVDMSLSPDAVSKGGALNVLCNVEDIKYGEGSLLLLIGQVTNSPEYGLGMNLRTMVPLINIPREELAVSETTTSPDGKQVKAVDFSEFEEPQA